MTQAAMYVKRNRNIEGLQDAAAWLYDTTQVELVQADNDPAGGTLNIYFEGAQLVDSEGYCLTRGLNPTVDADGEDQFVIYVDICVQYDLDPEDEDNIAAIQRQTWIIENSIYTSEQFIIRATCEALAIKRLFNQETMDHSHETICNQCRVNHLDLELVDLDQCVGDNEFGTNQCYNQLGFVDL